LVSKATYFIAGNTSRKKKSLINLKFSCRRHLTRRSSTPKVNRNTRQRKNKSELPKYEKFANYLFIKQQPSGEEQLTSFHPMQNIKKMFQTVVIISYNAHEIVATAKTIFIQWEIRVGKVVNMKSRRNQNNQQHQQLEPLAMYWSI